MQQENKIEKQIINLNFEKSLREKCNKKTMSIAQHSDYLKEDNLEVKCQLRHQEPKMALRYLRL